MLDVGNGVEEAQDLLARRNPRQVVVAPRVRNLVDAPGHAERHPVEKAKGRDVVPQKAERNFSLGHQIKEEGPHVFETELVDGLPEKLGVMLDAPDVVALGLRCELANLEILNEPLAYGSHGASLGQPAHNGRGKPRG